MKGRPLRGGDLEDQNLRGSNVNNASMKGRPIRGGDTVPSAPDSALRPHASMKGRPVKGGDARAVPPQPGQRVDASTKDRPVRRDGDRSCPSRRRSRCPSLDEGKRYPSAEPAQKSRSRGPLNRDQVAAHRAPLRCVVASESSRFRNRTTPSTPRARSHARALETSRSLTPSGSSEPGPGERPQLLAGQDRAKPGRPPRSLPHRDVEPLLPATAEMTAGLRRCR